MTFVHALSFVAACTISQRSTRSNPAEEVRCGSYCLTVAAMALGTSVTIDDVEKRLGEPGVRGYSLRQLDETARSFGLKTAAVQTDLAQLNYRKKALGERFVCLTLVNDDHFVLLFDSDRGQIKLCDPPSIKGVFRIFRG